MKERSMAADVTVETDGGGGELLSSVTGASDTSAFAPWSIQSVSSLICSFDSGPPGGIWLPVVSETLWARTLCLASPGTITFPEALPFNAPAALSSCRPAGAPAPLWHPVQLALKSG